MTGTYLLDSLRFTSPDWEMWRGAIRLLGTAVIALARCLDQLSLQSRTVKTNSVKALNLFTGTAGVPPAMSAQREHFYESGLRA